VRYGGALGTLGARKLGYAMLGSRRPEGGRTACVTWSGDA
jgi:hypothetical protein